MEAPRSLPACEADLAEWEVYADWLSTRGEPLGELLAHELALPAAPDAAALAAFHALAAFKQRERSPIACCLGHARTLTVIAVPKHKLGGAPHIEPGLLANVHQQLLAPVTSRLEQLECSYAATGDGKPWRRMFAVLPATCRHVSVLLTGRRLTEGAIDDLVGWLPPTVRELTVTPVLLDAGLHDLLARFVSDRFAVITLGHCHAAGELPQRLAMAVEATREVQLRIAQPELSRSIARDRYTVGSLAAARLVHPHGIAVLEPWPLLALQQRYGVISIRAQLARQLPEKYAIGIAPSGMLAVSSSGSDLMRRGERWTIRPSDELRVWLRGRRVTEIAEVRDGDLLELQQVSREREPREGERVPCTFEASD